MDVNIGNYECTEVWDGVFYKKLSNYPEITDWEIKNIIDFMNYEKMNGRKSEVICDDEKIVHPGAVNDGFLPIKVKDEVVLRDYVHSIIIPMAYKKGLQDIIPENLKEKVYYIENDCKDVWDWSEN